MEQQKTSSTPIVQISVATLLISLQKKKGESILFGTALALSKLELGIGAVPNGALMGLGDVNG